ncbi:MAG: NAD-glutamate dehydrogenase, partial [Chromatiales bacterium]|nr:NAD-glutamate dehydrogenase [Chromatiales bacterium]
MTVQPTTHPTEIMDEVAALARERVSAEDIDLVLAFVEGYYAGVSPDDLAERKPDDLYGAAAAHLNLARRRAPGTPKIRVYNPQVEQHGWQSTHTVVEIVTDDMPFLIDSVRMVLNRRGYTSHLVVHPVMRLRRGDGDRVEAFLALDDEAEGSAVEAVIHIETDRQTEQEALDAMGAEVLAALDDVRAAVEDWAAMREELRRSIADLRATPPPVDPEELAETCAFLEWIENNHFTFLGFAAFGVERTGGRDSGGRDRYVAVPGTGLGLLRDEGGRAREAFANLPLPRRRRDPQEPELLVLSRADVRSTVHRPSHLDYIGIRQFDAEGNVREVRRFLGLYTSAAYNRVPRDIP